MVKYLGKIKSLVDYSFFLCIALEIVIPLTANAEARYYCQGSPENGAILLNEYGERINSRSPDSVVILEATPSGEPQQYRINIGGGSEGYTVYKLRERETPYQEENAYIDINTFKNGVTCSAGAAIRDVLIAPNNRPR
jgi:hypothetical protein